MSQPIPWHQLFGLSLVDFFLGEPVDIELEKDLSIKQQLLDVVILKREGRIAKELPDGFGELNRHNLVTFKSHRDTLDDWAIEELIGHYVNYRKQVSASMQRLDPVEEFKLYALAVHSPRELFRSIEAKRIQQGVYEVVPIRKPIRVIVIRELPKAENNALMHLFSSQLDLVRYGAMHYRKQSRETSSLLMRLFQGYGLEVEMPMTLEELTEMTIRDLLEKLPAERKLEGIPTEKRLEGIPTEKRLEGIDADDLLAHLPEATRQALIQRLKQSEPSADSPDT